jgi:hypothetical protein
MSRLVPIAHLPFVLAAVLISIGPAVPDRTAAADESKGADCAALDDPAARLACFDAAFPRAPRTSSATPAVAAAAANEPAALTAAPVPAEKPVSEAEKFGLSTQQRAALEANPAELAPAATTAAVKTVSRLPSGYLLIGLDNDQVWQQTELDSQIRLQPGDRVTIRRASLGSHLLVTPAKYSTRVRRIQ